MTTRKRAGRRLTDDEELVLTLGPGVISFTTIEDVFGTIENARAGWLLHRDRLLAENGPGRRPWGWSEFEATAAELADEIALREHQRREQREALVQPSESDLSDKVVPLTHRVRLPHVSPNGNHNN